MSDIQQRIAAVLREHSMLECSWGTEPNDCTCGYSEKIDIDDPRWGDGWADHVAEVLVSKLLREERSRANPAAWFNSGPWLRRLVSRWELAE